MNNRPDVGPVAVSNIVPLMSIVYLIDILGEERNNLSNSLTACTDVRQNNHSTEAGSCHCTQVFICEGTAVHIRTPLVLVWVRTSFIYLAVDIMT